MPTNPLDDLRYRPKWTHACCVDHAEIDLWIARCPHCGRPAPEPLLRSRFDALLPGVFIPPSRDIGGVCECRRCHKRGSALDEFTSPYSGLCVKCSRQSAEDSEKLARLDALLASEEPPERLKEIASGMSPTTEAAERSVHKLWRWFREQLGSDKIGGNRMLQPIQDKVLVRLAEPEEMTANGILIPEKARDKLPQKAVVEAVGPGHWVKGRYLPLEVKVGDTVVVDRYHGQTVDGDLKRLIVKENEILMVLEESK